MKAYDVIVIGAGPAGYSAAIRCAQLGLRTACVDRWLDADGKPALGGTCINAGCIPSKVLLDVSDDYARLGRSGPRHGIHAADLQLDLDALQRHKQSVVNELSTQLQGQFKAERIDWLPGSARMLGNMQVEIDNGQQKKKPTLQASAIIIATGSLPVELAAAPVDHERIVSSSGALSFSEVPRRLAIIGAGVIGVEMASIWSRLGAKTILLEAQDEFLPTLDRELAALALAEFSKQGLEIRFGARVIATHPGANGVRIKYRDHDGDHELNADRLVVAVGRRPPGCDLCSEATGLQSDESGFIRVDDHCRTDVSGVYAIGDAVRGPMLAHKGIEEARAVAETIDGKPHQVNYQHIPWVIYSNPELAWVGASEEQLQALGTDYKVGRQSFQHNHRAQILGQPGGVVKVLSDAHSDALLGIHLFGPGASELINEAVLALEFSASAEDLARTCHAYPSLAQALRNAADQTPV